MKRFLTFIINVKHKQKAAPENEFLPDHLLRSNAQIFSTELIEEVATHKNFELLFAFTRDPKNIPHEFVRRFPSS